MECKNIDQVNSQEAKEQGCCLLERAEKITCTKRKDVRLHIRRFEKIKTRSQNRKDGTEKQNSFWSFVWRFFIGGKVGQAVDLCMREFIGGVIEKQHKYSAVLMTDHYINVHGDSVTMIFRLQPWSLPRCCWQITKRIFWRRWKSSR